MELAHQLGRRVGRGGEGHTVADSVSALGEAVVSCVAGGLSTVGDARQARLPYLFMEGTDYAAVARPLNVLGLLLGLVLVIIGLVSLIT